MMKKLIKISACLIALLNASVNAADDFKVIGYIASFNNMTTTIDNTDLSRLTHINISFANPDANGDLVKDGMLTCMTDENGQAVSATELQSVIDKAHAVDSLNFLDWALHWE